MSIERRYQVFISSTYTDLIKERNIIQSVLLTANCIPACMEGFVASDTNQFEEIKKVMNLCDYYLLIIGHKYGSINEKTKKSYTEMEFDYAVELKMPILVFVLSENYKKDNDVFDQQVARDDRYLLEQFKEKATNNRLTKQISSIDELGGAVAISILRMINDHPRNGWFRGPIVEENEFRKQIMQLEEENRKLRTDNEQYTLMINNLQEKIKPLSIEEKMRQKVKIVVTTDDSANKLIVQEIELITILYIITGRMQGKEYKGKISFLGDINNHILTYVLANADYKYSYASYSLADEDIAQKLIRYFNYLGILDYSIEKDDMLLLTLNEQGEMVLDSIGITPLLV